MTWKPSEVRPDTKASVRARRRVWAGAPVGAGDTARTGPAAGEGARDPGSVVADPERRSRTRAIAPAVPEQTAPTTSAPVSPSSSISTNPASAVPMIAPTVLAV